MLWIVKELVPNESWEYRHKPFSDGTIRIDWDMVYDFTRLDSSDSSLPDYTQEYYRLLVPYLKRIDEAFWEAMEEDCSR